MINQAQFINDLYSALLPLTDERIAEIYHEVNHHTIPTELSQVEPYKSCNDLMKLDLEYWATLEKIVNKIIPKQTIDKAHYKNLQKSGFDFGRFYLHNPLSR